MKAKSSLSKRLKFGLHLRKKNFPESQKVENLLWNAYQMVLFLRTFFSALIISFFWQQIRKFLSLEKFENTMKEECFFEKQTFSFAPKPSLQKWEGAKYAGGCRSSYFILL